MNKLQNLDILIEKTINEYDDEIVEISTIEQLYEISAMSGGNIAIGVDNKKLRRENKMISRKDIITERKLRQYIRNKIQSITTDKKSGTLKEEIVLRQIIRQILKEGDISDVHPHRSTGINTLEDVLKKAIPTLRMDFKRLTTEIFQIPLFNPSKEELGSGKNIFLNSSPFLANKISSVLSSKIIVPSEPKI